MTTADQLAVARESMEFWAPLVKADHQKWALIGCEAGEQGFRVGAVGDHGEAFGPFQDHLGRLLAIALGCGIDIRTASHLDQLKAVHWEMTAGAYRAVWPALIATTSLTNAMTVLVRKYEQSANQASDIIKRVGLATYWQAKLEGIENVVAGVV